MWVTLLGMLAYGMLHTALAGWFKPRFRARFGERTYHGVYRIVFNLVAVVSLLPVAIALLLIDRESLVIWQLSPALEPILWIFRLIGLAGLGLSVLQIDTGRFLGISQLHAYQQGRDLPLPDEPLQTGGVYHIVRHPLYLFSLMLIWPVGTMRAGYFGFCVGTTIYFLVGSLFEERRLLAGFGPAYADYRDRVPWMIPFVRIRRQHSQ
jgi:protein-S-isoprenylcysteine O-methyltransferase Ste14